MKKTKETSGLKSNKGITLISLMVTIIVILIISSSTMTISYDRFEINNYNKMRNDIELLRDKVENYYLRYNGLPLARDEKGNPIEYNYTTLDVLDKNVNDNEEYYILDLTAMEGLSLNYGIYGFENPNTSEDVYIINEESRQIYYVKGMIFDEVMYYTINNIEENPADKISTSKPKIKIISGEKNKEGVYVTEVQFEVIPGRDKGVIATKTEFSIDGGNTWKDINTLTNNIYTLSENKKYSVVVRSYDEIGNISTSDEIKDITIKHMKVIEAQEETKVFSQNVDVFDNNGEKIVVPRGFKVTKDASIVKEGIVIEDQNQNQFVWIPVKNINDMVMCQKHGASVTLNAETLKCSACGNDTKLAGKLYATNYNENFDSTLTGQTYNTDEGLREPANLTDSDYGDNVSRFSTITWTETLYQESFDKMVISVAKYGGFYVGRYETSFNGEIAQSKAGQIPMNNINWYEMYENSITYSKSNSNIGVVSEMIWGCQWDAMLQFILDGEDANHVTATTNVGHTHSDFTSKPYLTGGTNYSEIYTGDIEYNDKASNIYDLEGNLLEWTQNAQNTNSRVEFGGNCYYFSKSPGYHSSIYPTAGYADTGSRFTLYIV